MSRYVAVQHNMEFNELRDTQVPASIQKLKRSGLDFNLHESDGIDPVLFGEKMRQSGLLKKTFMDGKHDPSYKRKWVMFQILCIQSLYLLVWHYLRI